MYSWQRFYQAAIVETDGARLPALIQTAQAAIEARLQQFASCDGDCSEERLAIDDALAGLAVLRREVKALRQRVPATDRK